jgi:hypothetical protein
VNQQIMLTMPMLAEAPGAQLPEMPGEPRQHRDQAEDVAEEHHLERIEGRAQLADQDNHDGERGARGDHPERGAQRRREAGDQGGRRSDRKPEHVRLVRTRAPKLVVLAASHQTRSRATAM